MGKIIWSTLAGAVIGLLLVHPVAMLAYGMEHYHPSGPVNLAYFLHLMRQAFGPGLVHMGLFFALLGGAAGFGLGIFFLQKKRLLAETMECQRSLAGLETLRELMITLAHYIRNANMVIGGFSGRMLKQCPGLELQEELRLIQEASQEIDAVIASLQNLTEISTVEYTASSHELMIDLKKELEARLAKAHLSEDRNQGEKSSITHPISPKEDP
jgi:signal transduction histidine kinase